MITQETLLVPVTVSLATHTLYCKLNITFEKETLPEQREGISPILYAVVC